MKSYVIVHARHPDGKILLVLKDRPESQKGRLNLVGGKIEKGEMPTYAAQRELQEESGLVGTLPKLCGAIKGVDYVIYCFVVDVCDKAINPREGETEKVDWYPLDVFDDSRLMPNLRLVIPMLQMGVTDWVISDHKSSLGIPTHDVMVSLSADELFSEWATNA